jgi:hypothetical protein
VTHDSLDPALRARAEAARALLREDPAVDRLSVLAAVVAPRDPILEHVQPQGRGWRRTLNREAVFELFRLRDQGVSFGAIAMQFHVHKSTLVAISQKAARDGREVVLERYKSATTNGDGITDGKLASLIAVELKRRLAHWQPFTQREVADVLGVGKGTVDRDLNGGPDGADEAEPTAFVADPEPDLAPNWAANGLPEAGAERLREPRPQRPRQVRPLRTACLRGHEFTPENTVVKADGSRTCRACRRASSLAYYHRQRSTSNGNGAVAYASSGGVNPGGRPSTT